MLEKERRGSYLGRDVQMIPHVTGEVKTKLRELAVVSDADVVFVEIGGTVGDVENAYYIEAMRELAFEEGPDSCAFVALTYIISPAKLGEQKSKAAQLGIKSLLGMGIQPHIIACRGREPVTRKVREKLAIYSNVPIDRLFSMHDCESIYLIPEMLRAAGLDDEVVRILKLEDRAHEDSPPSQGGAGGGLNSACPSPADPPGPPLAKGGRARVAWNDFVSRIRSPQREIRIAVMGKYTTVRDSYASIIHALEHAGAARRVNVDIKWVDTTEFNDGRATREPPREGQQNSSRTCVTAPAMHECL